MIMIIIIVVGVVVMFCGTVQLCVRCFSGCRHPFKMIERVSEWVRALNEEKKLTLFICPAWFGLELKRVSVCVHVCIC